MTGLVPRGDPAVLRRHLPRQPWPAEREQLHRFTETRPSDHVAFLPGGDDRCFIAHARKIRAGEPWCARRHRSQRHVGVERHPGCVHGEDPLAAGHVRQRHLHSAFEPARTCQRRIEHVRSVRRSDREHVRAVEPVELGEQCDQRVLVFDRATWRAVLPVVHAPGARHCIDLVDEHDRGPMTARRGVQITDPLRAHADVHLHEIGRRCGDERHVRLLGHRASEECLAGTGRSDQQRAPWWCRTEPREPLRVAENLHHLAQVLHRLIASRHRSEPDRCRPAGLLVRRRTGATFLELAERDECSEHGSSDYPVASRRR